MPIELQDLTREPDFLEKTLFYCEQHEIFNCVSISARLNRDLPEDSAFQSLRLLVLKYPLLFSRICQSGSSIKYEPVDEILFEDVFIIDQTTEKCFKEFGADTKALTDVSFLENHKKKRALWKLVYHTKTKWLTFQSAHCFTDGGSVVAYLKDFVEGLNYVSGTEFTDTGSMSKTSGPEPRKVLFDLKKDLHLLEHKISPAFFERVQYQPTFSTKLMYHALKSTIAYWPGVIPNVIEKKRYESFFIDRAPEPFSSEHFYESSQIIDKNSRLNYTTPSFLNFDSSQLARLLEGCRKNNVKLQSYLLLVYAHTINELYPDLYSRKNLKAAVAASFRNRYDFLESHNSYLGNKGRFDDGFYTYAASFFLPPGTKFTWDTVRKYHEFIHAKISSEDWIKQYYLAQTMTAEDYMDHKLGTKKDDLFLSSTNLGFVKLLEYDDPQKIQIEDILFAPSAGALLGTHHMTVSSTTKSGLNIGISDADENVTDWAQFKEKLAQNLMGLIDS